MKFRPRHNVLASQRLEVALIYKEMLGIDEAIAYLLREGMPQNIVERVITTGRRRHDLPTIAQCETPLPPHAGCRRRNYVHSAIVEASLKIKEKLGEDWARTLLSNEKVPNSVVERVLARGPRQLRANVLSASAAIGNEKGNVSVKY